MDRKEIVIYNEPLTGRIAILTPVGAYDDIHDVVKQSLSTGVVYHVVSPGVIPMIGNYLDAVICHDDGKLSIDESQVRNITYNRWRNAREPILKRMDVEFMKAMESGDQTLISSIVTKKTALRNVTTIDLPAKNNNETIEQYIEKINASTPECLSW